MYGRTRGLWKTGILIFTPPPTHRAAHATHATPPGHVTDTPHTASRPPPTPPPTHRHPAHTTRTYACARTHTHTRANTHSVVLCLAVTRCLCLCPHTTSIPPPPTHTHTAVHTHTHSPDTHTALSFAWLGLPASVSAATHTPMWRTRPLVAPIHHTPTHPSPPPPRNTLSHGPTCHREHHTPPRPHKHTHTPDTHTALSFAWL